MREPHAQVIARRPEHVAAIDFLIGHAEVLIDREALDETVTIQTRRRPFRQQVVGQRHVHGQLDVASLVCARRRGHASAEFIAGSLRPDTDRAADGVATVGRALRPAQHLDTIDIDEVLNEKPGRPDLPHAVDIQTDVREPADREVGTIGTGAAALNVDVRNVVADVLETVEALQLQRVARHGDDRDGHLLEILLTARRRDGNLLEHACLAAFLRPGDLRRAAGRSGEHARDRYA